MTWVLLLPLFLFGCASVPDDRAAKLRENVPGAKAPSISAKAAAPYSTKGPTRSEPAYTDLWDRIRAGFALPDLDSRYVTDAERWYTQHPRFFDDVVERARLYLPYIVDEVEARGMPTEIALLPVVESAFKPTAYSHAHAAGLWQFIPETGRRYGLKQTWWYDGRRDVMQSTRAALDYLQFLHQEFQGDWFLALAAYNAGENRIRRGVKHNRKVGKPADFSHLRLHRETRRYVPKLIAVRNVVRDPARFGLALAPIPNEQYFAVVDVGSQIDLGIAAELAGMEPKSLQQLNPALRRWVTDPGGPHVLLLPVSQEARFVDGLRDLDPSERIRWTRHTVARGEVLGKIARNYGVTVADIRSTNKIKGDMIYIGQRLLIPVSSTRAMMVARSGEPQTHRVRSGESLWSISRRYGVTIGDLASWNQIANRHILKQGQQLIIYPAR